MIYNQAKSHSISLNPRSVNYVDSNFGFGCDSLDWMKFEYNCRNKFFLQLRKEFRNKNFEEKKNEYIKPKTRREN